MSRYRTISIKMWGDDRFQRLSKPQANAQTLWIYMLTGPHTTALPGAFVAGEAALAESLGWSIPSLKKAYAELIKEGLIEADSKTRLVFIPKAVRHNPPQSLNVVIGWRRAFDELPDCALKERIFLHVVEELIRLGKTEAFVKAFGEVFRYAFAYPEQEQEQNRNRTEQKCDLQQSRKLGRVPVPVPLSMPLTESMLSFAQEHGVTNAAEETEAMLDHFRAKGESRADWIATWRTWIRNSRKFNRSTNGTKTKTDRNLEAAQRLRARWGAEDGGSGVGGDF